MSAKSSDMVTRVDRLQDLDVKSVVEGTAARGFHIVRGLFDPMSLSACVQRIRTDVRLEDDNPSSGVAPEKLLQNFQKWSVGTRSPKDDLPRFFRIIYNPVWAEDVFGMREHFLKLIEIRNHLTGMPAGFAKGLEGGGLYSACRIQHYPQGGGFMGAHRDHIGEANLVGSPQTKFIQLLLVLTKPGTGFQTGGAFVIDDAGQRHYTEALAEVGDIAVYDGRTMHGVEDIDPHLPLDITTATGRLAAFATIYKKWS